MRYVFIGVLALNFTGAILLISFSDGWLASTDTLNVLFIFNSFGVCVALTITVSLLVN